jgi:iron complex transport system substrate-binding protein
MKNRLPTALLTALIILSAWPLAAQAQAQRVLSLDLCSDWMLARYADRAQVLALSPLNRRYPVAWLDANWPVHDGSLEQILQLKPDLVLVGEYNALLLRNRLQALGVRVEILPLPNTLHAVQAYTRQVLQLLGQPNQQNEAIPAPVLPSVPRQRLLLLGANGIGSGRDTLEAQLIEHAGWSNYLRHSGHAQLDLEQIVSDPPDAIVWAAPSSNALANQFAQHPALQRAIPAEHWLKTEDWRWQCPGPWMWDLLGELQPWPKP